jgi:CheY-like chemotaxis protein
MYAKYFRFAGARVITARDGLEAVQLARFYLPDAILLDLAMPRMTGWEAVAELKREGRTKSIPIVTLTGHVFERSREDAVRAGADMYLTKPCVPEVIFKLILQLLRDAGPRTTRGRA